MNEEKDIQIEEKNKLHTKRYWFMLGGIIGAIIIGYFIFDFCCGIFDVKRIYFKNY